MSNVNDLVRDAFASELRLKSEITKCAGPCVDTALNWLVIGAVAFPYLLKRGLPTYLPIHTRFLIGSFSAVLMSYYMGYRSKIKCEENIIKLFAEHREEELEEKKEDLRKISPLKRFLLRFT